MENCASYPDLAGKVAIITGIGQIVDNGPNHWGNGAATARLLYKNGVKIFGCDNNLEAATLTKTRVQEDGPGVIDVMRADVTKATDVKQLVAECMRVHGRVDILVNNVGRSAPGDPASMDEETWDAQTDINIKSVYLTCHEVLPIMESQQSGSVVNISSIAGLRYIGKPQVAYSAFKAAVIQFTKATAVIYAPKRVRLNTVVPGLMYTPLTSFLAEKYAGGDLEGFLAKRNKAVPLGKQGDALDTACAIVFLASDSAKYITGQNIVVDGGITSATA